MGALERTLEGHSRAVASVAFLCNGLLASGSYDRTVRLWDSSTGAVILDSLLLCMGTDVGCSANVCFEGSRKIRPPWKLCC